MVTVAVTSDSHIPGRADAIPDVFREQIAGADHVVHAGDVTDRATLETLRTLADGALTAVRGNADVGTLDLPTVATFAAGGVTFVVTHGTGEVDSYEARVAAAVRATARTAGTPETTVVGIAGHTHEVLDTVVDGVRLLNPGSVTGAWPATRATMFVLDVEDGEVETTLLEA